MQPSPHFPTDSSIDTPSDFSGLWIPLITPFHHGAVDHPALARLVKHYAKTGVAGFVACGSTGEAAALSEAEQLAVLDTVMKASADLPVIMGMSGYNMTQTLSWVETVSRHLTQGRLAGLLVPAPCYIRPSQAGLLHWFNAIADASPVPVVIYDIPQRTGVVMDGDTLLKLAKHPNIRAVKDCGNSAAKTQALIADGRLQVLAGEDLQIFNTVALGGAGAITASAHVHTARFVDVIRLLRRGAQVEGMGKSTLLNIEKARTAWHALVPVIEAMFAEPNPASIKAALAAQGLIHNELRAPMMVACLPISPALTQL